MVKENPFNLLVGPFDTLKVVQQKNCLLGIVPEGVLPAFHGIATKPDSAYLPLLNQMQVPGPRASVRSVLRLVEHGFVEKWMRGYGNFIDGLSARPADGCAEGPAHFPLRLGQLAGAFLALAAGLGLAGAVFVLETHDRLSRSFGPPGPPRRLPTISAFGTRLS